MSDAPELFHLGNKVRRLRELKGMKQDTLATEIGISRQSLYKIERSETIEDTLLKKISDVLGVSVEAIKQFDDETIISNINSFYDNSAFNFQCTFNPLDKLIETMEQNKELYERLLKSEREKIELLTKSLEAATQK